MKYLSRVLAAALVALWVPAVASAATLPLPQGDSTFSLSIGALPPVVLPNNASSLAVSSGSGTFTEPAGVFGPASINLPASLFTGVSLISGLTLAGIGNGTVVCSNATPALSCSGGLAGTTLVNVLQLFNLSIPLNVVGSPGASIKVSSGGIAITVVGQKWTAAPTSVTGTGDAPPLNGIAFSNAGTDQRTAGHEGSLVLVTGFKAITNVAGTLPGFAVQTLSLPEPTSLLLSAAAAGGLGLFVYARRRRR
jgi:hypothetical protein